MTNLQLNDQQMEMLLNRYEVETTVPYLIGNFEEDEAKARLDSGIYAAKEQIKGATYESNQNRITDILGQFMEQVVKKPTQEASEYENNIAEEASALIQFCLSEGVIVQEQLDNEHSFSRAREELSLKQRGEFYMESAALLVREYRGAMHDTSKDIREWVNYAVQSAQYEGFDTIDYNKKSDKWIIDFVKRHHIVPMAEIHEVSRLLAIKDNMIAMYTAKANTFALGESQYKNALMYAFLYLENLAEQRKREQQYINEEAKRLQVKQEELLFKEYGVRRALTEEEKAVLRASIKPYKYTGFDSITSLFPVGAKELLSWSRNNTFTVFTEEAVRTAAYFDVSREITPVEQEILKSLVGEQVSFKEGVMEGTPYMVSLEDRMSTEGKEVTPKKGELEKAGLSAEAIADILESKFKRGARAWFGGAQTGKVLHVSIYKRSFKLWLDDFKNM